MTDGQIGALIVMGIISIPFIMTCLLGYDDLERRAWWIILMFALAFSIPPLVTLWVKGVFG